MTILTKKLLFGDGNNIFYIYKCKEELKDLKDMLEIIEKAILKNEPLNLMTYEGICFLFIRSIISYKKMAYDNLLLGHYETANMIFRCIVENRVCLDVMRKYNEKELWKYYLIKTCWDVLAASGKDLSEEHFKAIENLCKEYNVESEFIVKSKKGKSQKPYAYIEKSYGWTYKVGNKNFNFAGICKLVDIQNYEEFKYMSMYSHGTSLYFKMRPPVPEESVWNLIAGIYSGLYEYALDYCGDDLDKRFWDLAEKIEGTIYSFCGTWSE